MKILFVSDEESPYLWDYYKPGKLDGIDLIISCGDLSPEYLTFLVTMGRAPVLYVHGNHDDEYKRNPPEGCECIDGKIVEVGGLRILGLGGSQRYNRGYHQYTERQMKMRILMLNHQLRKHKGVDIVVTHAPVRGMGDDDSRVHRGFESFLYLLEKYKPHYWVYGHVHLRYSNRHQRLIQHKNTTLINACERYMLEIDV